MPTGRPPSCQCGQCPKCKHAQYMREWYRRKSPEERRAWIAQRDPAVVRINDRKRYDRNTEKRIALAHQWQKANAEKMRKAKREWNRRNAEKIRAHGIVFRALKTGELTKEPCEVCGRTDKLHAHHDDYSKPLQVRWRCPLHHSALHRKSRSLPF